MTNPAPTLVSTFELLFSPQIPPFAPPPVQRQNEQVIKGYFLTISNPNTTDYFFDVFFHCNVDNPIPTRTLARAVAFLDDVSTGTPLVLNALSTTDFYAVVTVRARATVLIGVLPAFFNATGLVSDVIDCRGWVEITLPPKFISTPRLGASVPQAPAPVTILVTPEERLTFLPLPGDSASAVEAQAAFALPLAGGQASVTVPPQPPLRLAVQLGVLSNRLSGVLSAEPGILSAALAAAVAAAPAVQSGKVSAEKVLGDLGIEVVAAD